MKCVVTGATGHIGNVLVRKLVEKGYEVKAFILENEIHDYLDELGITVAYGDIRNLESLKTAFKGADAVFHLAGIIDIGSGNKELIHTVNVKGTQNVLKACHEQQVKKLIYTSSVHAIKEEPKEQIIQETNYFDPKSVKGTYAKTKAEATAYLLANQTPTTDIIIVHPSGVIGPYEYIPSNLGQLIIDCANKKIGAYLSGGYNFVDVRDVAQGIIAALEKGKAGECYILAGHYVSVKQLMLEIEKITGTKAPTFKIARWFAYGTGFLSEAYSKIRKEKPLFTSYAVYTLGTNSNFSIEKAKQQLDYSVQDIHKTLVDTIAWYKEQKKIL